MPGFPKYPSALIFTDPLNLPTVTRAGRPTDLETRHHRST